MIDEGIGNWPSRRAFLSGNEIALIDGAIRHTYRDLEERSNRVANALGARGIRKGDRVAVLLDNGTEFIELLFATAKLGAIFVPLNTRLSAGEVAYILGDASADALVWSARLHTTAVGALSAEDVHTRIQIVAGGAAGHFESLEVITMEASDRRVPTPVAEDDIALLVYTSGTTGEPKGAMLTHGNVLWNVINALTVGRGLTAADRTVTVAPLFHIAGMGVHTLPLLYVGGTVILQSSFGPAETLSLMAAERVTVQLLVPAMWAALMAVPDFDSYDLSALARAVTGSAPIPLPVLDFFIERGIPFQEGFGMTETAPGISFLDAPHMRTKAGSIGRAMFHVETRIVDGGDEDVQPGGIGELVVRGPNVFAGYWGRPVATAEAFRNGWFHTGDMARADDEGFMTLVDRKKDMLITGGENVYPAEVERVLHQHPHIREVAIVGIPHAKWGETPLAVIVTAEGDEPTEQEIITFARDRLAHFKCPTRVEFVGTLPRNATGKVLKRELRERYVALHDAVGQ